MDKMKKDKKKKYIKAIIETFMADFCPSCFNKPLKGWHPCCERFEGISKQEEKGNLKLPRSTTNFKKVMGIRKVGAVRLINQQQIKEIVMAFLPGGKGYWHYDK